jgi:hypothetical protein
VKSTTSTVTAQCCIVFVLGERWSQMKKEKGNPEMNKHGSYQPLLAS